MERIEFGYRFEDWEVVDPDPREVLSGWRSADGNPVVVTLPSTNPAWRVWVPQMERAYEVTGKKAEERAFSIAVGFVEQQTSPRPPTSDQSNTTS